MQARQLAELKANEGSQIVKIGTTPLTAGTGGAGAGGPFAVLGPADPETGQRAQRGSASTLDAAQTLRNSFGDGSIVQKLGTAATPKPVVDKFAGAADNYLQGVRSVGSLSPGRRETLELRVPQNISPSRAFTIGQSAARGERLSEIASAPTLINGDKGELLTALELARSQASAVSGTAARAAVSDYTSRINALTSNAIREDASAWGRMKKRLYADKPNAQLTSEEREKIQVAVDSEGQANAAAKQRSAAEAAEKKAAKAAKKEK